VKRKTSKTNDDIKSDSLGFENNFSSDKDTKEISISFEDALLKLETIVKELEAGELTLENSLDKFAEGVFLSKKCLHKLNAAQEKMDKILKEENGELVLKSFEFQEGGTQ
jgi:exodeoxyribonuclease VII small subunit